MQDTICFRREFDFRPGDYDDIRGLNLEFDSKLPNLAAWLNGKSLEIASTGKRQVSLSLDQLRKGRNVLAVQVGPHAVGTEIKKPDRARGPKLQDIYTSANLYARPDTGDEVLSMNELEQIGLFRDLAKKIRDRLDQYPNAIILRKYEKGDVICFQGEPGHSAFYILSTEDVLRLRLEQAEFRTEELNAMSDEDKQPENLSSLYAELQQTRAAFQGAASDSVRGSVDFQEREAALQADIAKMEEFLALAESVAQMRAAAPADNSMHGEMRRRVTVHIVPVAQRISQPKTWADRLRNTFRRNKSKGGTGRTTIPNDGPADVDIVTKQIPMFEGEIFGEMACMTLGPRTATITADGEVYMVEFLRNVFARMQEDDSYREKVLKMYRERVLASHLENLVFFEELTDEQKKFLGDNVGLSIIEAGEVICNEGEPSDSVFIVKTGQVQVIKNPQGTELALMPQHIVNWGEFARELLKGDPGIVIPCPDCGYELRLLDRRFLGRHGRCPQCNVKFELKEPDPAAAKSGGIDIAAQPSVRDKVAALRGQIAAPGSGGDSKDKIAQMRAGAKKKKESGGGTDKIAQMRAAAAKKKAGGGGGTDDKIAQMRAKAAGKKKDTPEKPEKKAAAGGGTSDKIAQMRAKAAAKKSDQGGNDKIAQMRAAAAKKKAAGGGGTDDKIAQMRAKAAAKKKDGPEKPEKKAAGGGTSDKIAEMRAKAAAKKTGGGAGPADKIAQMRAAAAAKKKGGAAGAGGASDKIAQMRAAAKAKAGGGGAKKPSSPAKPKLPKPKKPATKKAEPSFTAAVWNELSDAEQDAVRRIAFNEGKQGDETIILSALNALIRKREFATNKAFTAVIKGDKKIATFPTNKKQWTGMHVCVAGRAVLQGVFKNQLKPPGENEQKRSPRVLSYLSRGDIFGETGIVRKTPRNATCIAYDHPVEEGKSREKGTVHLITIKAEAFDQLLDESPSLKHRIDKIIADHEAREQAHELEPVWEENSILTSPEFESQGFIQGQKLMLIDLDSCTRCGDCVRACINTHDDGFSRLFLDGPSFDRFLVPSACRNCHDPACMIGCPVNAIQKGGNNQIEITDWCIGCEKCAKQCPYDSIQMHDTGVIPNRAAGWKFMPHAAVAGRNWQGLRYRDSIWETDSAPFSWDLDLRERLVEHTPRSYAPPEEMEDVPLKYQDNVLSLRMDVDRVPPRPPGTEDFDPDKLRLKLQPYRAVVCDQCSGQSNQQAACVEQCPHEAAMRVDSRKNFPIGLTTVESDNRNLQKVEQVAT